MPDVKRMVLDVLKPHHPNVVEFARRVAGDQPGCRVTVTVTEMDERTETLIVAIEGERIDFDAVDGKLRSMGASLHSIDEVEVAQGANATDSP